LGESSPVCHISTIRQRKTLDVEKDVSNVRAKCSTPQQPSQHRS